MKRNGKKFVYNCVLFTTVLFNATLVLAQTQKEDVPGEVPRVGQETKMFLKIERDRLEGKISDKEAFMIKARWLFVPETLAPDSEYALRSGEPAAPEECGTGFFKELHKVYPQLNAQEKALLKVWSEDFRVIIEAREKEGAVAQAKSPAGSSGK